MKKRILNINILLLTLLSLASCRKECSFSEFCKNAQNLESNPYTSFEVKGERKSGSAVVTIDNKYFLNEDGRYLALNENDAEITFYATYTIDNFTKEDESQLGYTYYSGDSFKIEVDNDNEKATLEYNKYGYITKLLYDSSTLSRDYSFTWLK